jgi:hypothetical protein
MHFLVNQIQKMVVANVSVSIDSYHNKKNVNNFLSTN